MINREIYIKNNKSVVEEIDRKLQRLIFDALEANNKARLSEAFEYVYNEYYTKLKILACQKVDNLFDAEDVVVDTFANLYKAILEKKDIQYLKGYLYTIFLYKCMDYNIDNKNWNNNTNLISDFSDYVDYSDFIEALEFDDFIERLLTPIERYIVIHYIIREESLLEVQTQLNLKHVDIYKLYKKILKKLKKGVKELYG